MENKDKNKKHEAVLIDRLNETEVNRGWKYPEFLRLPKTGSRCPITGLSRTTLNELTLPTKANDYRPPVKSVSIRKRGALRGVRLIPTDALLGYLRDQISLAEKTENKGIK